MLRQTTRALAGMGGRAAGASAPGSAFAPHAAAGASWMQNRSIGKVGVPENYGQIDGVGTKFLGTPANHREVRHERIGMSSPRVSRDDSPLDAVRRAPAPVARGSRAGVVNVDNPKPTRRTRPAFFFFFCRLLVVVLASDETRPSRLRAHALITHSTSTSIRPRPEP